MVSLVPVSAVLASQRGVQPAPVIDTRDASQRDYWAYRLRVSANDLDAAIATVGSSVAAVRRHLGNKPASTPEITPESSLRQAKAPPGEDGAF
jgi:hypothetical protein